ncbi:MAG: ATP-grasp domain-containing protein [Candidatus Omnitrophica bacterium]|nr:ATP-grasp domain-containing protein [Candidatus Omnitrophota bacterium]
MSDQSNIVVLITGLGGGSHGMQILKALKLSDLPYYFIGADVTKASYGLSMVDKSYILPLANTPEYIDALVNILKTDNVKVLFHGSEPELKVMSKNAEIFKDMEVFLPINPQEIIDLCMDKYEMAKHLENKGFNVPRTFLISSVEDTRNIDIYPLVCKPHIGGGGSNNVFIVQDSNELGLISRYLLGYLEGFIAQEYIGTPENEYTVGVLNDLEGKTIDSIAVKRYLFSTLSNRIKVANKTNRKELGEVLTISSGISQGEIGRFKEVTEYCEEVACSIGAKGAINFQCRVFDGKVYIFEINPRFSGTTSLRAIAGFNEPDLLVRKYILGEEINKIHYKEGVILRALEEKFIANL